MLRAVAYTFGAIIVITLLRGAIGLLIKTFGQLTRPKPAQPSANQLRCPTCGSIVDGPLKRGDV